MTDPAMLVIEEAPGVLGSYVALRGRSTLIGRDSQCDVVLEDREVSRRHAVVRREADRYVLADLDSRNGTILNGCRLSGAAALRDGDVILIGPRFRMRFVDRDSTVPTERSRAAIRVDHDTRSVSIDGKLVTPPLAPHQFALVEMLTGEPERVFSRVEIAHACYPEAIGAVSDLAIEGLVRRVRSRLTELDPRSEWIQAVRGHGYRLLPPSHQPVSDT